MPTTRPRAVVSVYAMIAALCFTMPLRAQSSAGEQLENGQIAVKIYVTMPQAGLRYGRPISDYDVRVIAPSGQQSSLSTGPTGRTEIHLFPGMYRVVSVKQLHWFDHRYWWDLQVKVRKGMHAVNLTPKNSVQDQVASTIAP